MLTGALPDRAGADDGARRVPDLVLPGLVPAVLFAGAEDLVSGDLALEERVGAEPCPDGLALADAAGSDRPEVLAAACEAPGSTTAITPAAAALVTAMPVVAVLSDRRPRSRSAMARDAAAAPARRPRGSSGEPTGNCGMLMRQSVVGRLPRALGLR